MKTKFLNQGLIDRLLISGIALIILGGCKSVQQTPSAQSNDRLINITPSFDPSPSSTPTILPTEITTLTPIPEISTPSPTPSPTIDDLCSNSGFPDDFEPSHVPDTLLQMDTEILNQASQRTEVDSYKFSSYGAASYGYEDRLHYTCQEEIPSTEILSYCIFEREISNIHVYTGEPRGTPERMINESFVRGSEAWVRPEGGEWYLTQTLDEIDIEDIRDTYRVSVFYFDDLEECEIGEEHPGLMNKCFKVNIPKFLQEVDFETVTYVDCVVDNQGVVWYDPISSLPRQLDIFFNVAVFYEGQEGDWPYNVVVEMSQNFLAFNETYTYPDPESD